MKPPGYDVLVAVHLWVERVRDPIAAISDNITAPSDTRVDEPRWHARLLWASRFRVDSLDLTDVRILPRHLPLSPADAWKCLLSIPEADGAIFTQSLSTRPGGHYIGRTDVLVIMANAQVQVKVQ